MTSFFGLANIIHDEYMQDAKKTRG